MDDASSNPSYKRKCEHWLTSFRNYLTPIVESQESVIIWTGLFVLSSALRNHIFIPRYYLGSYDCYPNLYIIVVSPPGKRKSTTINVSELFLDEVADKVGLTQSPELVTKEALLKTLVDSPDVSMSIRAPEFGEFIAKSGPSMYGWLTNMYDGKRKIRSNTLSREEEFAERPCINLIGATTPIWIQKNMPEDIIGGGFASRVVFIYESGVRTRKIYYDDFMDLQGNKHEQLKNDLVEDLQHIANSIYGEFKIDKKAKEFMKDWYETEKYRTIQDDGLDSYFERKPTLVHKLAQIFHVCYSDELTLVRKDMESAIELIEEIEKKLPQAMQQINSDIHAVNLRGIFSFIKNANGKKVTKREVYDRFKYAALPVKIDELLMALLQIGYIEFTKIDGVINYEATYDGDY